MNKVQIADWVESFRSDMRYQDYLKQGEYPAWRKSFITRHPDYASLPKDAGQFFDGLDFFSVENWEVLHNLPETLWPRLAAEMDNQLLLDGFVFEHEAWLSLKIQMKKAIDKTKEILEKYKFGVALKPVEDPGLPEMKGLSWLTIQQSGENAPTPPYRFVRVDALFVPEKFQSKPHQRFKGTASVYNKKKPFELFVARISRFNPTPETPPAEIKQFKQEVVLLEAMKTELNTWLKLLEHPAEKPDESSQTSKTNTAE